MRELKYELVDVFTDKPFGGNQLAVFTNPGDLDAALMQQIARELNLSETTFVFPPADAHNHFRVRIFTAARELPFAGHPTVGTAFVLQHLGLFDPSAELRLEEGVGVIGVTYAPQPDGQLLVTMQQPIPQFGAIAADRAAVAALLSLDEGDLIPDCPVQVVSAGVPFLYVPLRTLDAIRRVRVRLDLLADQLEGVDSTYLFVFTPQVERVGSTVHARMFAPELGITEDPATGSASGPLGAYLLKYGLVDAAAAQQMISEQGFELGRPSILHISVQTSGDTITAVSVGGYTQPIGSGVLQLQD